jgi:hypothetical protein
VTKLAMLIGAKPKNNKVGPTVRLEGGNYIARLENVEDSVIMLCSSSRGEIIKITPDLRFFSLASDDYWTLVTFAGKEPYINVSMEKVA